jgi:hypothetical protein
MVPYVVCTSQILQKTLLVLTVFCSLQIILTLLLIMVVFAVCWMPLQFIILYSEYRVITKDDLHRKRKIEQHELYLKGRGKTQTLRVGKQFLVYYLHPIPAQKGQDKLRLIGVCI